MKRRTKFRIILPVGLGMSVIISYVVSSILHGEENLASNIFAFIVLVLTGFGVGCMLDHVSIHLEEWKQTPLRELVIRYLRWYFYWGWPMAPIGFGGMLMFLGIAVGWPLAELSTEDRFFVLLMFVPGVSLLGWGIGVYLKRFIWYLRKQSQTQGRKEVTDITGTKSGKPDRE